jgi:hypothetical protein
MAGEGSFRVEDLLEALASQLDRTQDAMSMKAVNRPLTYAIRDFSLELKAYVEMDEEGDVRLRSAGSQDTGASTLHIGFTTMTRPMIEENTIPLTLAAAPRLEELGLDADERKKLERLGVRNAAQLRRLGQVTGSSTVSRYSGITVDRLRQALQFGRPHVATVQPDTPTPAVELPAAGEGNGREHAPVTPPRRPREVQPEPVEERPAISVAPGTQRLRLAGRNLLGDGGAPIVRLGEETLPVLEANPERVVVALPQGTPGGDLQIEHEDGEVQSFALTVEPEAGEYDPWSPEA